MDAYFRDCPWIVPGSNAHGVDGLAREQALAQGKSDLSIG
jgi:hypothetical protein